MSLIETFREPLPQINPKDRGDAYIYPVHVIRHLSVPPPNPPMQSFFDVLEKRHSERVMGPASEEMVGALLWFGARVCAEYDSPHGHIQARPAPSAGGLQCADILISRVDSIPGIHLYDPIAHALCEVRPCVPDLVYQYYTEIEEAFPQSEGCVITLLSDHVKAYAKYEHAESLLLRDSGALMATLQLCATAFGHAFCFAGNLGSTLCRAIVDIPNARVAVGSGIFGAMVDI